jgi:hypothetical protein
MSKANDFPENLIARVRRGALACGEQAELERLLAASATLRVSHQVGRDFDRIAAVQAGDEQRVARFVAAALRARRRSWRGRLGARRMSVWMLAAAVFGCCGVAYGLRGVLWPNRTSAVAAHATVRAQDTSTRSRRASAPRGEASEPNELSSDAATMNSSSDSTNAASLTYPSSRSDAPVRSSDRSAPRASASLMPTPLPEAAAASNSVRLAATAAFAPEQPAEPTAASLLRLANAARSRGRTDEAVSLLREIQQRYRGSPEATLSLVSLGKLLLLKGAPEAALQQFSSYLFVGGTLEEEALVGRAQALAALARSSEERSTWEALVARFPGSVYVARAQERLRILGDNATK